MLTPEEFTFVIDCTRTAKDDVFVRRMRTTLAEGVNWPALMLFAIPHGVFPMVVNAVNLHAADLVPSAMLSQLARILGKAEARNRQQWQALAEVMQAFESAGIRALAYKGPALTSLAYGNLQLRESHDLDIWVDSSRTAEAGRMLVDLGYRTAVYKASEPHISTEARVHMEFLSANGEVVIDLQDLQRRPQFFFCPEFDTIWSRQQSATAFGIALPTLCTEDLILSLAVHGSKHLWRRLNWVADLAALLASAPQIDWATMIERARQWRCYRRLLITMALLNQLYGIKLSPALLSELLRYEPASRFAVEFTERIRTSMEPSTVNKYFNGFAHQFHATDRLVDRLNLVRQKLHNGAERLPGEVKKRLSVTKRPSKFGARNGNLSLPRLTSQINPDADAGSR